MVNQTITCFLQKPSALFILSDPKNIESEHGQLKTFFKDMYSCDSSEFRWQEICKKPEATVVKIGLQWLQGRSSQGREQKKYVNMLRWDYSVYTGGSVVVCKSM